MSEGKKALDFVATTTITKTPWSAFFSSLPPNPKKNPQSLSSL